MKKILVLLLLLASQAAWAWPGSGTSGDPYQIASVADWNTLVANVNNGTTYSGQYFCLTADISISTMVGNSVDHSFRGTFDGRGHTLTINYNTASDYTAPFSYIQGATFKKLRVTGSITTTMNLAAGIAGLNTGSTATFEQCVTDVAISSSSTTIVGWGAYDYHGGFLARTTGVNVNLTDCICGGSVNGSSASQSKGAGFVGLAENCTVTGTRCLSTTSYTNVSSWNSLCHSAGATRSTSVFYYVNANDNESNAGTPVTTSQLADGSYATALQADHSTTVWIQYAAINQPMLKLFALNQANDGYYLIGSEQEWRNFATLIQTTPTANARMTADISVTTMIGSSDKPFSGIFDGDGHKLTVNISCTTTQFVAPFHRVSGGNIRNLYVDGTVSSNQYHMSGLIGRATGTVSINNCVVAVNIQMSCDYAGGFVGNGGSHQHNDESFVVMTDCLFNGTFTGVGGTKSKAAGFYGWGASTPAFINCLENGAYENISSDHVPYFYEGGDNRNPTASSNSYYKHGSMSASWVTNASEMSNTNLVAGLGSKWVIDFITNQPMPKLFAMDQAHPTIPVTSATIFGESKYVTTFYHGTLDYQLSNGALAYTAEKDGSGKVVFYRIGANSNVIPAGTAVIIVADAADDITLTKLNSTTVTAKAGNILKGSDADVTVSEGKVNGKTPYVLGVAGEPATLGFFPFTGSTIPAGKAYYLDN